MAPLSSILSWNIPWTEEPGKLQSIGPQRGSWSIDQLNTHIFCVCIYIYIYAYPDTWITWELGLPTPKQSKIPVWLLTPPKLTRIQKTKIMASGPITSWQIDWDTVETVADFIFLDSKITADGDCSHEIKRHLLLGRKVMTKLDSILKSRDITLSTKVSLVKTMVFPVVMYGCESWTVKKAECWRTDALNCSVGEDSWESLGLRGDPTSPS